MEGGSFGEIFSQKSQCRTKLKGGPLASPGTVCYAENQEKPFWFSSWSNRYNKKFCRTFGRNILVTSGVSKKTLTKSHDFSRLFSRTAPTKKCSPDATKSRKLRKGTNQSTDYAGPMTSLP